MFEVAKLSKYTWVFYFVELIIAYIFHISAPLCMFSWLLEGASYFYSKLVPTILKFKKFYNYTLSVAQTHKLNQLDNIHERSTAQTHPTLAVRQAETVMGQLFPASRQCLGVVNVVNSLSSNGLKTPSSGTVDNVSKIPQQNILAK